MSKYRVVGVKRIEGTAKASGQPFDMCRLYCLVPIEQAAGKTKVTGYGMELGEMELLPEALVQFSAVQFPAEVELNIDQRFLFGEFRSVVTGMRAEPALRKAS